MNDPTVDPVARAQLVSHLEVCTERYSNIWRVLGEIKENIRVNAEVSQGRFDSMNGRMWAILVSTCGASVAGLCALVFYEITTKRL